MDTNQAEHASAYSIRDVSGVPLRPEDTMLEYRLPDGACVWLPESLVGCILHQADDDKRPSEAHDEGEKSCCFS